MKHSHSTLLVTATVAGLLLMPGRAVAQTPVFSDNFSSSTLNSAFSAPTANSTSYEAVSTEALTTSSIGAGNLALGFGTGSGNGYQVQGLFASSPVTLATFGDYIQLAVTFTDTGGFLTTANGTLCAGMYNTGGVGPLAGGINNENSANTTAATGGAQNWLGYVGQITTNHPGILLRAAQTGTGNNNQDVAFGGAISTSKGYDNPALTLATGNQSLFLSANSQYTMVLTYALTGVNTLAISNSLYSGSGTGGTLLSEFDTTASGANFLTNSFDGLAFGFYANKNQNSAIDINQITVSDVIQPVPEPSALALAGLGLLALTRRLRRRKAV